MEILSPAGSFEALCAAVHNGADAVYIGGSQFSARRNAQNFTDEALLEAVDFCHVRGVRVYVCCNTLMKESELPEAMRFIRYLYEIGVDALIVQDLGLLTKVRQELPEMPVHASTQMTVTNSEGVNLLADLGVRRVVLAREVTGTQLNLICKNARAEIEYFVHGALCISYSGQCLMSSILGGRSGNRGGCAQPCRLPYTLLSGGKPVTQKRALLCPKDLCLADRVDELKKMGVASLKIEGRMKSPEYVGMVTRVYKKAVTEGVSDEEIQDMLKFFSRGGSCTGYFDGCSYDKMMDPVSDTKIANALPVLDKQKKQMPISLSLVAVAGEALTLSATAETGETVTVFGEICEEARVRATDEERMKEQLNKLGETPFYAKDVAVYASDNVAVSAKALNSIRRQAAEELINQIVQKYRRLPVAASEVITRPGGVQKAEIQLCAEVMTEEQLQAAVDCGIQRVYVPAYLWKLAAKVKEPILQLLPLNHEGKACDKEAKLVCVQNIGQITKAAGKCFVTGHRLNVTNSETVSALKKMGAGRVCLSPELNVKGICAISRKTKVPLEVIGYGRLPLMLLANCIVKSNGLCSGEQGCKNKGFVLRDRKNEEFPLVPTQCGNVIYNTKPIFMADRMEELLMTGVQSIRLCFTDEDYETCCRVIGDYQRGLDGKKVGTPDGNFTRGHFYRGMQ